MSEEDKRRALEDLENNLPYDYCRSCDSPDGLYHEWIDEDSWQYKIKMLLEEKDKEIEFHKNNEQIAIDCQNKLNEEIERLNNIINESGKDSVKRLNNIMQFVENTVIIGGHGYDYRKAIRMLYEGCEYDDVLNWYNAQIGAE